MKRFVTALTMAAVLSVCSTTVSAAAPVNGQNYVDVKIQHRKPLSSRGSSLGGSSP